MRTELIQNNCWSTERTKLRTAFKTVMQSNGKWVQEACSYIWRTEAMQSIWTFEMIYRICQGSLLGEQGPPQKRNCWQVKQKLEWERDSRHKARGIVDQEISGEYCLSILFEHWKSNKSSKTAEKLPWAMPAQSLGDLFLLRKKLQKNVSVTPLQNWFKESSSITSL